jgi:hypothetical protein
MAVPLNQCCMALKDIEEVWDLQRKLIEDQCLPLYPASDTIRNVGEGRDIYSACLGLSTL